MQFSYHQKINPLIVAEAITYANRERVKVKKRTDANHGEIKKALQQIGCTVFDLSSVGGGVTDLLCGYRGKNYLIEIKDGDKPPSARKLTPAQKLFHSLWRGQKCVVKNVDEAVKVVTGVEL